MVKLTQVHLLTNDILEAIKLLLEAKGVARAEHVCSFSMITSRRDADEDRIEVILQNEEVK